MSPEQIAPGSTLGHYRILQHLGTGGMGVVYKAEDTTLGRSVALKLLRPEMLGDAATTARFEREARMLAALNHPHIATIYGVEERNGLRFLALEYVDGPTLAERLGRRALPVVQAARIADQIAAALEAAHMSGIIHRDLKPANIKVSDEDRVKVLDFGLAKPLRRLEVAASPDTARTVTQGLTRGIAIVGTAAYMSPEQVTGKELDARTDIWSFGCVLYEMLSGRRSFAGSTVTEILAAVLEREPDWSALPRDLPTRLVLLVQRCLRKDPNRRLRAIGDARLELDELPADAPTTKNPMTRRTILGALGGAVAGTAAGFAIPRYRNGVPRRLARFAIAAPDGNRFVASFNRRIGISRDGAHIFLSTVGPGGDAFYYRALSEAQASRVKDITAGASATTFSPDGRWVAFLTASTGGFAYGSADRKSVV